MHTEYGKKRMERIHTMLMEFGNRNFAYRLERTDLNDEIEALTAIVNMTAEEASNSFLHQIYANQKETYKYLVKASFILDDHDTIMAFSLGAKQLLFLDADELKAKPFHAFLTDTSKLAWNQLKFRWTQTSPSEHEESIKLSLKTKEGLILTINCLASKPVVDIGKPEITMITSVVMVKNSKEWEKELWKTVTSRKDWDVSCAESVKKRPNLGPIDFEKIRQVRDHILCNQDKPLPSLKELAHTFGTNEYKLKLGFKELYNQTVFGFLTSERLRKASVIIQHTHVRLKEVAHITGFKSVPHFSRAFKKKYGYTPRDLRKSS